MSQQIPDNYNHLDAQGIDAIHMLCVGSLVVNKGLSVDTKVLEDLVYDAVKPVLIDVMIRKTLMDRAKESIFLTDLLPKYAKVFKDNHLNRDEVRDLLLFIGCDDIRDKIFDDVLMGQMLDPEKRGKISFMTIMSYFSISEVT